LPLPAEVQPSSRYSPPTSSLPPKPVSFYDASGNSAGYMGGSQGSAGLMSSSPAGAEGMFDDILARFNALPTVAPGHEGTYLYFSPMFEMYLTVYICCIFRSPCSSKATLCSARVCPTTIPSGSRRT
jgi:hypothetical protein